VPLRRSRAFAVALVTFAAFIDLVAYSIAVPVLPDLSQRLGASPTTVGLLFASFGLTVLLFAVPMGAVSDRIGRRMPMVAGLVVLAGASALFAFADRLWLLFAARMIQGAADAVTWVVGFALVADLYGPAERGRVMGMVMAGTSAGLMVGPTIGGWLYEAGGVHLPFLTVAAASLATAALFLWIRPPASRAEREVVPIRLVVRHPAVLVCALVVVAAASTIAMLEPVLALWLASSLGLGPARIGMVFGMAAVCATVLHPVYGRFADRWGGRPVALVGLLCTAGMLPVLSLASSFGSATALYVLQAAAIALVVTPSLAYMAEAVSRAGVGSFGVAYGLYNVAWGVGLLAGPAVGGFLFERIGFGRLTHVWMPAIVAITAALSRADRPLPAGPPSTRSASTPRR
jgi:multidrug resistance protein